jgi:hypothetical protein
MARSSLILPSNEAQRQPVRLTRPGPLSGKGAIRLETAGAPRKHRRPRHESLEHASPAVRKGWLIAIILFSLLIHALLVMTILFVGLHTPAWAEPPPPEKPTAINLVLSPPPEPPPPALHKPDFIPTRPQQNAPHQEAPLISDNDNQLQSKNRTSRDQNAPVPDVTGKPDHSFDLYSTPALPEVNTNPSAPAPTQPTQKQQQPDQKTAQQPNKATKPAEADPNAIHPTDNPEKATAANQKPVDQQYDPNGLPVLPALNAPTIQPQKPPPDQVPNPHRPAPPRSEPSFAVYQSDVAGQAGQPGDNSPAAMATDLGRYKAKIYRAVGARWYDKVASQFQVLGVGTVHISYTIYSDGRLVINADPDKDNPALMLLHSISLNAMTEAAPFDAFSDAMKKEVGDSYTDDFTFSIYGN